MKRYITAAAVAGLVILGGSPAFADDTPDCTDIQHQVKVYADPYNLDTDGDGVGCESYPGPPTALDIDDPTLRGEDPGPDAATETPKQLAHTGAHGWGPTTHPIRWMGFSGGLIVAGGVALALARKQAIGTTR